MKALGAMKRLFLLSSLLLSICFSCGDTEGSAGQQDSLNALPIVAGDGYEGIVGEKPMAVAVDTPKVDTIVREATTTPAGNPQIKEYNTHEDRVLDSLKREKEKKLHKNEPK